MWSCPACGSQLEVVQDLSGLHELAGEVLASGAHGGGVWRYAPFIPVAPESIVSMGEGNTPVVTLARLGAEIGLPGLYAKLEFMAPTGSFKDRGTTAMVSRARQLGVSRLVEDSSGNAGASVAAYCARAGIRASIFVPASAPRAKKAQIAYYGAQLVEVGGTREDVASAALESCRHDGAYYGSHNLDPFFLEGTKSFAYEVAAQFPGDPPEHVVMPVGNGSLFLGSWKGFGELRGMGILARLPRHHVAQAAACMPVVDAFRRGLDQTEEIPTFPTVAGGISIARPSRGRLILEAMKGSGGAAAAVGDEEILHWQRRLAALEGLFCEPTSAAAFAALPHLLRAGAIKAEERVLVAVTGMGLKDTGVLGET